MRIAVLSAEPSGKKLAEALLQELPADHLHHDLAVVGVPGRTVARALRVASELRQLEHDHVVTIDAPSFHLRLAPLLRQPVVHWVSPQIWAWRAHRRHRVARSIDALGCLFPFEPGLYRGTGLRTVWTGHPTMHAPLSPRPEVLGIAAGSRASERARLGPIFVEVAAALGLPTVEAVPPGCTPVTTGPTTPDVPSMAQQVSVALTSCGTATLELAVAGVPMVAAYAMGPVSWQVAQAFVRAPSAVLPNLLLGARVVEEFHQDLEVGALCKALERAPRTRERLLETQNLTRAAGAAARMAALITEH